MPCARSRKTGCGRRKERQHGKTVEAIEQPIAAPASAPLSARVSGKRSAALRHLCAQSLVFVLFPGPPHAGKARAEHDADGGGTARAVSRPRKFTDVCSWAPRHDGARAPACVCRRPLARIVSQHAVSAVPSSSCSKPMEGIGKPSAAPAYTTLGLRLLHQKACLICNLRREDACVRLSLALGLSRFSLSCVSGKP